MSDTLYHKNLTALLRMVPQETVGAVTDAAASALNIVAEAGSSDINLDLGGTTLYAGGAAAFAAGQTARFCAAPKRLHFEAPRLDSNWVKSEGRFYSKLAGRAGPLPPPADSLNDVPVGALVSFGVGLGLHLPLLQRQLRFRDLVLIEPYPHFLQASLRVVDWDALIRDTENAGGTLYLFTGGDPAALALKAHEALRSHSFARLDGTYVLTHYNSPVCDKARDMFAEQVPTLASSLGFVDDECRMVRNAVANLRADRGKIVSEPYRDAGAPPAIVVGSGPSLDASIDTLKRLRTDALLISGGTALSALLDAGLTPDLHCEVENVEGLYDGLAMVKERHDLSAIPILCAATVDPRIPGLFGEKLFYFQDRVTTTILFEGHYGRWRHATPTVTNLALRAGVWLGAQDVYLFGVDLGSVDTEKHHSSHSYYAWTEDEYWSSGAGMDRFDIPLEGNFAKTVYTNMALLFTRAFFNAFAASHPQTRIHNCSDGARIENTVPTPPGDVRLPASSGAVSAVVAAVISEADETAAAAIAATPVLQAYRDALRDWMDAARSALSAAESVSAAIDRLHPLVDQTRGGTAAERAARGCFSGTMLLLLQYAFAHSRRLQPDDRAAFDTLAIDEMLAHTDVMQALIEDELAMLL